MNVDEAMETAKAYLVAREQMQEPLFESEEVAVTLAREVGRLRVWKTRWKDAAQKLRRQLEESGDGDTWRRACRRVQLELEKTRTKVERLRAILPPTAHTGVRNGPGDGSWSVFAEKVVAERDEAVAEVERLRAELAAVKSDGIPPIIPNSMWTDDGGRLVVYCHNTSNAMQFQEWLHERMKIL